MVLTQRLLTSSVKKTNYILLAFLVEIKLTGKNVDKLECTRRIGVNQMNEAKQWIESLQMQRHPEGGWFREVYRSHETIYHQCLPSRFTGDRTFSTAIYFLLNETDFSALHRIKQDELWHFYDGTSLTIHMIDPAGNYSIIKLGKDLHSGEHPMAVVQAGSLFGAAVNNSESYALVGCTVAPGFNFEDFVMPDCEQLLELYPQHQHIIEKLTR